MFYVHTRVRDALQLLFVLGVLIAGTPAEATLLSSTQASDGNDSKSLGPPNTGRSVAVAPDGTIYVAYLSGDQLQLRVARSIDGGASFQPSVAAVTSTTNILSTNIAVASTGIVYAAAIENDLSMTLGRSTDGGQSFTPVALGTASGTSEIGVVTDGSYVYVAVTGGPNVVNVLSSSDQGLTFPTLATVSASLVFWHLNVDPTNGDVIVSGDDPTIHVAVSTDHGVSFGAVQNFTGPDFLSSTGISAGPLGHYLFVGGAIGSTGIRVDLGDYTSTPLPNLPMTGSDPSAESLAGDSGGNLVVGYINAAGNAAFEVSNDLGVNFGTEVSVAGASRDTVDINNRYGDVLFAYLLGGQVYLDVHCDVIGFCMDVQVSDGNAYARYGHGTNYLVTVTNRLAVAYSGLQISGNFSAALDLAGASWSCVAGPYSQCSQAAGSGAFDTTFDVGPGDTVSWVVSVPVLANSAEDTAEFDVMLGTRTVSDTDTLVLFRDGFNVTNGNGTGVPTPAAGN